MADQKDQGTDPPVEKPAFLPLKKRAMAEKVLVDYNRAPESKSESDRDSSDDKDTLQELQIKAFYAVLQSLTLETSTMTNKRSQLIDKLVNELGITDETHISIADTIQKKLLAVQQMEESSPDTEMQILPETSLTQYSTPLSSFAPKSGKSWGSVNPESLVGKYVRIRMEDDGEFEEYIIHAYDAKKDMHRILIPDLDPMDVEDDDPLSWTDLRDFPPKDMMWEGGEKPNFDAPNQQS